MKLKQETKDLIKAIDYDIQMMDSWFQYVINNGANKYSKPEFNYHYKLARGNFLDLIKKIKEGGEL